MRPTSPTPSTTQHEPEPELDVDDDSLEQLLITDSHSVEEGSGDTIEAQRHVVRTELDGQTRSAVLHRDDFTVEVLRFSRNSSGDDNRILVTSETDKVLGTSGVRRDGVIGLEAETEQFGNTTLTDRLRTTVV